MPALSIKGEVGQQIGYINAMTVGVINFIILVILGVLVYKGGPIISIDFLFTEPTDGMTAGGILPALVGTIWLVTVALLAAAAAVFGFLAPDAPTRLPSQIEPFPICVTGWPTWLGR